MAEEKVTKRDQTLPGSSIDEEYIATLARDTWNRTQQQRDDFIERLREYEQSWRDLNPRRASPIWEQSSNYHVPFTLTLGKATHARLWQLFGSTTGFFSVQARQQILQGKERMIKAFMDYVLDDLSNSKQGVRNELDAWLWDVVFNGSGYLKVFWKKEEKEVLEVVPTTETTEKLIVDPQTLTGRTEVETRLVEKEQLRTDVLESPQIRRILFEDVALPIGANDPQDAEHVITRVFMTDEDLKSRAEQGIFFKDAVEEALPFRNNEFIQEGNFTDIKQERNDMDGYDDDNFGTQRHIVLEFYGPAYVFARDVNPTEFDNDLKERTTEIVAWVHKNTGRVLGWTELARISPGGIRPIFKADYATFPERAHGVGVPELLFDTQRQIDDMYNTRNDAGKLASLPMFAYRASSSLKPSQMRIRPGQGIPVDDVSDLRIFNFPPLTGYGFQEEQRLNSYGSGLTAISDLQLGLPPRQVGALRNATGSNLLAQESSIQLQIHFDRIARTMNRLLQFVFRLTRERMPSQMVFRVTGERGEPIFGNISRDDLKGDFDFKIRVDILGQSELEKQQLSVLRMQTLMNPVFLQTGVVTPKNLFALAEDFLKTHKAARKIDDYLTEPPDHTGNVVTVLERISMIIVGLIDNIEDTVRLEEDHEKALAQLDQFAEMTEFGILRPPQLAAFEALRQRHRQLLQAQQAPGNPNVSGVQVPRTGFEGITSEAGADTLQGPVGQPNGPVV